jgi:hypothetical protein
LERGPATDTEKLSRERFRLAQAIAADRNARDLEQRPLANPAIIGKKKGKKGAGG